MTLKEMSDYILQGEKYPYGNVRQSLILADGTRISVQASSYHYCTPQIGDAEAYQTVEVVVYGDINPFAAYREPDESICVRVPTWRVYKFIMECGGVKEASGV